MQEKDKRYIREHIHKESIKEISEKLGLKERKIRKFLEKEKMGEQTEDLHPGTENSVLKAFDQKYRFLIIFALLLWGFLVYSNTFLSSFQFDDKLSIVNNSSIRHIRNLGDIWNFWPTRFITYLSIAFNYHVGGLDVFGYHLFNLAVHLGSAFLVWWFSLLTFSTPVMRDQKIARHAKLISFFAGLVFVVHPIQTQAVTYIIQRTASLAAFFYLASLCLYIQSRLLEEKKQRYGMFYYAGSLGAAILAMFTKEMTITLPFMILLYEFYFLRGPKGIKWRGLVLFFLTLAIIPLTMFFTKSVDFVQMRKVTEGSTPISSGEYLLTQFRVLLTYLRLLFVPLHQNLDYDYPVARSLMEPPILAGLLILMTIFMSAVRLFSKYKIISFSVFWFFLTLLPESSIIPIRDVIFEHRLYLPMVGFSLFAVSGLYDLFKGKNLNRMIFLLLVLSFVYSGLAYKRNFVWKDDFTLWEDIISKSPRKARSYNDRGNAYAMKRNFKEAIANYNKVIEIGLEQIAAQKNRTNLTAEKEKVSPATSDSSKSAAAHLTLPAAYYNRGLVYKNMGNFSQAISDFTSAIEIDSQLVLAYVNRARLYFQDGEYEKSAKDVSRAQNLGYPMDLEFMEKLTGVSLRKTLP